LNVQRLHYRITRIISCQCRGKCAGQAGNVETTTTRKHRHHLAL